MFYITKSNFCKMYKSTVVWILNLVRDNIKILNKFEIQIDKMRTNMWLFSWFSLCVSVVAGGLKLLMVKPEVLTLEAERISITARWLERCLNYCPLLRWISLPLLQCYETNSYSCHAPCKTIWSAYRQNSRSYPLVANLYKLVWTFGVGDDTSHI